MINIMHKSIGSSNSKKKNIVYPALRSSSMFNQAPTKIVIFSANAELMAATWVSQFYQIFGPNDGVETCQWQRRESSGEKLGSSELCESIHIR